MLPKPKHLGAEYAAQFQDASVAESYRYRPPYPDEVLQRLATGVLAQPRSILELGCGTGELSRGLAERGLHVDAVDPSSEMLLRARRLPGGALPNLTWQCGTAEGTPLDGPYDLVIAAESIHWFDWGRVFPRIEATLSPTGRLVLVDRISRGAWDTEVRELIPLYSTNQDYAPYDIVEELRARGLFEVEERVVTRLEPFHQAIDDYVESFHSRNGFSRERMSTVNAREFDSRLRRIVLPFAASDERLEFEIAAQIVWGRPAPGPEER